MKTRLFHWMEVLSGKFWALPVMLLVLSTVLAFVNITLDRISFTGIYIPDSILLHFNDMGNVRSLLSLTAGSVLGVAGVSFSITIASLTLASQQFGPRLLRNFMHDRFNQMVIGVFIATFLYCVLLLQFTNAIEDKHIIPVISMTTLLVLIVLNLLVLVFFIHHISNAIQAESIIDDVWLELHKRLQIMFPEIGEDKDESPGELPESIRKLMEKKGKPVSICKPGYLQAVDVAALRAFAEEKSLLIELNYRPGQFIMSNSEVALLLGENSEQENCSEKIHSALIIGDTQTAEQDPEFAIRQLVEIALRALSPGINDPFTAMACMDRLGEAITLVMDRNPPENIYCDENGDPRLVLKPIDFDGIVGTVFNQIRQNSEGKIDIIIKLHDVISHLALHVKRKAQAQSLMRQLQAIHQTCSDTVKAELDRQAVQKLYQTACQRLDNCLEKPQGCD